MMFFEFLFILILFRSIFIIEIFSLFILIPIEFVFMISLFLSLLRWSF